MDCSNKMDVKITILQVDVANLRPNTWNTNSVGAQNFEKLKGSIEKLGFFKPILARELEDGFFEILGGEHRWRAAIEQGISTVPVLSVGKISDVVAKQMSLVDNRLASIDYDAIKLQKELESLVLDDIEVFGFEERELNVLVGSMTEEMDTDSLVIDLGEETKRQKDEHTEISREVAAEEVRVVDVLGFKTLPAGSAIVVGDLLAHMEEMTGESGVDAFVAYAEKISSGEMAA